jgi:hypothetical protein
MISTSYGLPECFDSLAILGKGDGEACAHSAGIKDIHSYGMHTVSLFVVLHEEEWVEVKVAKEGDVGPERNYKEQAWHR